GLTPAAAQQRLADLGLILGEVENQTADSVVIQQSPEPGATTQSGSSVDLVFGPQLIQEIVEYTVPNGGNNRNREIEIYTEDINGTRLAFSTRAKPGETVRQRVTGSGFLKVTIRDDGETVKEEVFP
ncbi:MAG TPA: PASTA domain-containing protein, partial [Rhodocyclaceae bacterium]|nr:PASTA domain-containing protein [Rhodocyclaceae bacterium]